MSATCDFHEGRAPRAVVLATFNDGETESLCETCLMEWMIPAETQVESFRPFQDWNGYQAGTTYSRATDDSWRFALKVS